MSVPQATEFPPAVAPIISIVTCGASATLAALKGSVLAATTRRIRLWPLATGVYINSGTADANSLPLGTAVTEIVGTATSLAALELYSATAIKLGILEEG
jgi:hypothetical protein